MMVLTWLSYLVKRCGDTESSYRGASKGIQTVVCVFMMFCAETGACVYVGPKSLPSLRKFPPSRFPRGTLENPRFVAFFLYEK